MTAIQRIWTQLYTVELDPLLVLSIILIGGLIGGWAARRAHIPGLTGNLLAGIIMGPVCLDLFSGTNVTATLRPLSTFAMGLIAVSVGSHLSYRRIHNALRRIITIALCEALGAILLVTFVTRSLGLPWFVALTLGTIAAATSPATTLSLLREMRAKGTFSKTLVSVVALDNMLCIMLFAFSSTLMGDFCSHGADARIDLSYAITHVSWQLAGAVILALVLGKTTERLIHSTHTHEFSVIFIIILLNVGISSTFDLSPLLTCLFFGVYLGNASEETARQTQALGPIELLLFSCFFTMAGVSLHLHTILHAGLLCIGYLTARIAGKSLGALIGGALLARSSRRIWSNMAIGLTPQAAVAIGLVFLLGNDPRVPEATWSLIEAIVLGAVAVNEVIGPFFTRIAIRRSREDNKDRRRLIEFLQEEYILTDLKAKEKWDALHQMAHFYIRTHGVAPHKEQELYNSIMEREEECTTAIGRGAAIPHGRIAEGNGIKGVLGICREGLDFDAYDGAPVHIIMLVVSPRGYEKEHLEVMASLAQMISDDIIRTRLLAAIDPNDAWEIIESEEVRTYNYFLDQEESLPPTKTETV